MTEKDLSVDNQRKRKKNTETDLDRIELRQKKGVWKRFVKLFPKCNLPWLWLALYVILQVGIVDLGINETDLTAQLFAGDTSAALLTKLIGVMIINLLGSSLLVFVKNLTSARINRNMRMVLTRKVLRLPMSYFKEENPREAIYRIVNNAIVIDSTIMLVIMPILTAGYTMLKVFSKVFTYDWRLSLVMLAFVPVQFLIAFIFGRISHFISNRGAGLSASLTQKLSEMITNIPLAKAFAKEDKETARGEKLVDRLYRVSVKSSWITQFRDLSSAVISFLGSFAICSVGLLLIQGGGITKRAWIAFFLFSGVFSGAVEQLMMYWNNLKTIQGNADKVAEIMNEPEERQDGEACTALRGDLSLESVRFGYAENKPILRNASCIFPDNCVTALLGVSGCGKTTLTRLLMRLYTPQSGTITAGERPIGEYALDDYRSQFVAVSQENMFFSGTVRENVCYGNGGVSDDALTEALKRARAYDFVMDMPEGLDSRLEEYGNNLSGGQRQRLAIARALLSEAHYFVLDEPISAMDAIAAAELMEVLKDVSANRCVIIIAHTSAVLSLAQHVVVVEDGAITGQGKKEEVQKTNRFLSELIAKKVTE